MLYLTLVHLLSLFLICDIASDFVYSVLVSWEGLNPSIRIFC